MNLETLKHTDLIQQPGAPLLDRVESSPESEPNGAVQVVDGLAGVRTGPDPSPGLAITRAAWEGMRLLLIPALLLGSLIAGIIVIGLAQRAGWLQPVSGGGAPDAASASAGESETMWICPMFCVPPTSEPGRCPVCGMELVPAASGSASGPSSKIEIDARARRVAGIETVIAREEMLTRQIRGVGEIEVDESRMKTLSAYIDGRIEELYADFTGVRVARGDSLAMLYSPELYAAQVEFVNTLKYAGENAGGNPRVAASNQRLVTSSRERLIEMGMTEEQIQQIEADKAASRRVALHAPISGTVIEKLAVTGQYVKAGAPIYRLADLSSVWLVLELFPEDAATIKLGQQVTASMQSRPDVTLEGTVEFVEPVVDPNMRTVGVRVALENADGQLRPGEFAHATMEVPLLSENGMARPAIVVPRHSLLSVGETSLIYVEEKEGEFHLRKVRTGPTADAMVAILSGLEAGESVVARSAFLVDAQMQLQGNPSLIDPDKAIVPTVASPDTTGEGTATTSEEIRKALEPLSPDDRALAEQQVICPVTEAPLGSGGMGTPIKVDVGGREVFICCEGCRGSLLKEPEKYLQVLDDYSANGSDSEPSHEHPPMKSPDNQLPRMELPQMELPGMELPETKTPN